MTSTRWSLGLLLLLAVGCDPAPAEVDSGGGIDAAIVGDTGPRPDTGPPMDTGPRPDVGPVDAGGEIDTGSVADTGTPAVDAASDIDAFVDPCVPHTFVVTVVGSAYVFDGGAPNATLTLCSGVTYMFDMSAVGATHPMELRRGAATAAAIPPAVTTSYTVPAAMGMRPDSYICTIHSFGGDIVVP